MMGCNSWTRIILVYLQKKSLSRRGQSGPNLAKLCSPMSHDSLSEDLFDGLWHYEAQYR